MKVHALPGYTVREFDSWEEFELWTTYIELIQL